MATNGQQQLGDLRDLDAGELLAEDAEEGEEQECLELRDQNREEAEQLFRLERMAAEQDTAIARLKQKVRELRALVAAAPSGGA